MRGKKIKDLGEYLTGKTGLDADERQQWRDCIKKLMEEGNKEESMKVFQSMSYWKEKYQKV